MTAAGSVKVGTIDPATQGDVIVMDGFYTRARVDSRGSPHSVRYVLRRLPAFLVGRGARGRFACRVFVLAVDRARPLAFCQWADDETVDGEFRPGDLLMVSAAAVYPVGSRSLPFVGYPAP